MKKLLERDGIEYSEKIFNSDDGVGALGPNPFVSHFITYSALQ